jgi:hypothetical protein
MLYLTTLQVVVIHCGTVVWRFYVAKHPMKKKKDIVVNE